jgi:hypothetical protein
MHGTPVLRRLKRNTGSQPSLLSSKAQYLKKPSEHIVPWVSKNIFSAYTKQ